MAVGPRTGWAQEIPEQYDDEKQRPPAREARLRAARQAKEKKLSPPRQSLLERISFFVEDRQLLVDFPDIKIAGLRPVLGGLRSGSGTTAGLRFEPLDDDGPAYFSLEGLGSLRRYWGAQSILGYDAGVLAGYSYGDYQHIPQDDFYGIGPDVPDSLESNYRWNRGIAGTVVGVRPSSSLDVGVHASYQNNALGPGQNKALWSEKPDDLPDLRSVDYDQDIPGVSGNRYIDVDYAMLGGYAEVDTRKLISEEEGVLELENSPIYSSRFAPIEDRLRGISLDADLGYYLASHVIHHQALDGKPFSFTRYELEAQEYLPIRHGFQVMALRQYLSLSQPDEDDKIPFYKLETLGGSRTIRGYDTYRFRGRNVALVNAEFRWQVWVRLDMALFMDVGYVFQSYDEIDYTEDLKEGYGLGFRFNSSTGTLGRFDIAYSEEGLRTYLKLGSVL